MRDVKKGLFSVNSDVLGLFKESAKELLKEISAEEAL